jgi:N-ethylmaleimide reductase
MLFNGRCRLTSTEQIMSLLFSETTLGPLKLQNHLVMSPMTRSRAIGNVPNDLMVEYYRQRASAGLIVTEGTSPSPNGLGYPRIPGIFSAAQSEAPRFLFNLCIPAALPIR